MDYLPGMVGELTGLLSGINNGLSLQWINGVINGEITLPIAFVSHYSIGFCMLGTGIHYEEPMPGINRYSLSSIYVNNRQFPLSLILVGY